jgi:hypothetical protein
MNRRIDSRRAESRSRSRSPEADPGLLSMYRPHRNIQLVANRNNIPSNLNSIYDNRRFLVEEQNSQPIKQINDSKEEVKQVQFTNKYKITKEHLSEGAELFDAVVCILCKYMSIDACSTGCCDKIVCKSCINSWLGVNNSCAECKAPNCKISPQTKFMARVFKAFKLKCRFEGCTDKSLNYMSYTEHEKFCLNNPDRLISCEKCKLDFPKSGFNTHDCVSELVKIYQILMEENKKIKVYQEKQQKDPISKHVRLSLK